MSSISTGWSDALSYMTWPRGFAIGRCRRSMRLFASDAMAKPAAV